MRHALVGVLLGRVHSAHGQDAVRKLIQEPTATSGGTARQILDFYDSDVAQHRYEPGEADALRALLDQYDPPEQAVDQGDQDMPNNS